MPDIPIEDKSSIKKLAKCFSRILSRVSFNNGSQIYHYTFQHLYKRSARWKYCLLCGEIGLPEAFQKGEHDCPNAVFYNIQVLVSTSWFKLRDFFLEQGYKEVLNLLGINSKFVNHKEDCEEE